MAAVVARASRRLEAPPERVLAVLRDYRETRPRILTDHYSAYRVERGGEGHGTVFSYHFAAGGRERDYRFHVEERDRMLLERDELSSFIGTWTVVPAGAAGTVTIEGSWQGAGGIAGMFERLFAPLGLRRIYGQVLDRVAQTVQA